MKKILGLSLAMVPAVSFAAIDGLEGVAELVSDLFGLIMPLILSLAVIYFVWSLVKYMTKAGEAKDDARDQMIWGVVILFVMVSVWGLVNILGDTVDLDTSVPTVDWEVTN
ncbi:pilin [Patescibacteria group bacterium]|nr:pilin [Patescibacteria group bacterium]